MFKIPKSKIDIEKNELALLIKLAKGYRTVNEFARECKFNDSTIIEDLLSGKYLKVQPDILLKISNASEGRVSFRQLMIVCGFDEYDVPISSFQNYSIKRSEIYLIDFEFGHDSEQGGVRPAIVLQNNLGNKYSTTLVVIPITSTLNKILPTHVEIGEESGLLHRSYVLTEQIRCVSKRRLFFNKIPMKVGEAPEEVMKLIQYALKKECGLIDVFFNEKYAYELIRSISILNYNIKNCKTKNLVEIKKEKINNLKEYCEMYNKDFREVFSQYKQSQLSCAI